MKSIDLRCKSWHGRDFYLKLSSIFFHSFDVQVEHFWSFLSTEDDEWSFVYLKFGDCRGFPAQPIKSKLQKFLGDSLAWMHTLLCHSFLYLENKFEDFVLMLRWDCLCVCRGNCFLIFIYFCRFCRSWIWMPSRLSKPVSQLHGVLIFISH